MFDATSMSSKDVSRFWKKVDKTSDCWNWLGAPTNNGYGQFGVGRKIRLAHILSYQLAYGSTNDLCVLHHCDNRMCVNPAHLFLGTRTDNNNDMRKKGRLKLCGNGHRKLTNEQVSEIVHKLTTVPRKVLATQYGVTVQYIGELARGQTRKDVTNV